MKRILALVAVAATSLVLAFQAHAQLGIVAGITSSKTDMSTTAEVKDIALYHAGLLCKFDLGAGFALQPGVLYQVKGANLGSLNTATSEDFKLKTGYVEVPMGIQWGPDLMAFRPYVFAEPFVGYQITSSDKGTADLTEWSRQAKNKVEYGFGVGGGLEIASHLQLSVQWFKNLGSMFGEEDIDMVNKVKDVKNFQGIKVSFAILF